MALQLFYLPIFIVFLTLILGPLMFYLLCRLEKLDKNLTKFPTGLASSVGDIIFLPLFNGVATYYGIFIKIPKNNTILILTVFISIIVWLLYLKYKKDLSNYNHWLRPKKGKLSFVGWYHSFYFALQFFFSVISIIYFYDKIILWILLIGYLLTLSHSKYTYGF